MLVESTGPTSPPPRVVEGGQGANLPELLTFLIAARRLILSITAAVVVAGLLYAKVATPIYRSDTLIQVEEKKKGIAGLEDLNALMPSDNAADAEIEILRSRSLVGEVVRKLSLDLSVAPRHFPLIGDAIARAHRGSDVARAPPWLPYFAWGGERLGVDRLAIPEALERRDLILTAAGNERYALLRSNGELLLEGEVGKPAESRSLPATIFVSELRARPGTQFVLVKQSEQDAIEQLQKDLVITQRGKKTGIIRVELFGPDRLRLVKTLDALANAYVRQNIERKSEEAEKTLQFVTSQLPEVKSRLDASEAALNEFRAKHRTVDVSLETKAAIDRSVEIEKMAAELQIQRAELGQKFTSNHPFLATVEQKLSELQSQRSSLNARLKALPESELNSLRLLREVKVSSELYTLLLNKAQELRVVRSGTIGNVRILDQALVPQMPVRPRLGSVLIFSLLLGFAGGLVTAFVRRALSRGVQDPDLLEAATGVAVYVSVPHSDLQERIGRGRLPGAATTLTRCDPTDLAVESLRSLRTSLQFALIDASNRVVTFAGPGPGIGKSFVATNLAEVVAASGRKVLLIDADMRNGSLHSAFGVTRAPGLSDLIVGSIALGPAVRYISEKLHLLTGGLIPPNPSELLMSSRFREVLERAGSAYDLLVVDTPPILAVTDAAVIARLSGVTLLVLRAGQHPLREILVALKRLAHVGVRPAGLVLNDVTAEAGATGYGYHYQYDYRPKKGRVSG